MMQKLFYKTNLINIAKKTNHLIFFKALNILHLLNFSNKKTWQKVRTSIKILYLAIFNYHYIFIL
jgi:hypothetical protein